MKKILIAGGTSAIARGFARAAAEHGDALFLVDRSQERLEETAADLKVRGASAVAIHVMDLCDTANLPGMVAKASAAMDGLDTLLVAHGTLTNQPAAEADPLVLEREVATNFTSGAVILSLVAARFEAQKKGAIGVITSVAGMRGRKTNYIYGAAKAALIAFVSGLRGRLLPAGVSVTDIRPGFVNTPMTAGFKKGPLFAEPEPIGRAIYKAVDARRDIVYLPWFWRWIMAIITSIPEFMFKKMSI